MIALIQRVSQAHVNIDFQQVAKIDRGIVALIGVEKGDDDACAQRLVDKVIQYRIFADADGKMNKSLLDLQADLLLVPQFTLAADTRSGTRPGFSTAASPNEAKRYFEDVVNVARQRVKNVACGVFGADMKVTLTNDGPVTFWLSV